jgi:hypothetical protein
MPPPVAVHRIDAQADDPGLAFVEFGLAEASRAIELDPMSVNARQNRLFILLPARRYEEAVAQSRDVSARGDRVCAREGGPARGGDRCVEAARGAIVA